jgi:hypothetical protein
MEIAFSFFYCRLIFVSVSGWREKLSFRGIAIGAGVGLIEESTELFGYGTDMELRMVWVWYLLMAVVHTGLFSKTPALKKVMNWPGY